ncbi:hypothetical protein ACCS91_05905 [Rhizobium ruizarguesonis]|uniref:hypothetical protein n=2 Tax=Rhizobium ruizarguesonis TaxID=2081791 RepID=UPI0010305F16|nr:hypothetical protein [Rhizobium ruizarguesonis]QIJ44451.1 hypothetical protein G7039_30445 [Rhizobium leguminosarum]TAW68083.1 hypothetical protein ELI10_31420 [Rhizobium ruizarguesonis]TAX04076.1 hypothetical protein ELI09_32095 [Rhizobium ruizarguesonis]TAX07055.1 hypothetical protein ELI08_31415 [Rhizobium ruizarguesonis]
MAQTAGLVSQKEVWRGQEGFRHLERAIGRVEFSGSVVRILPFRLLQARGALSVKRGNHAMKHGRPDNRSERFRELSIKMRLRMHKASHEIMRAKSQAEADQIVYGEYGTLDLSLLSERMERAEEVAKTVARWQQSGSKLHDVSRLLSTVAEGLTPAIPDMPSARV